MTAWIDSPLFGVTLSILCFCVGQWIFQKTKSPLANPLVIAFILVVLFLQAFDISLETYQKGGDIISFFLLPATACLGLQVYRVWPLIKKAWLPILVGCTVGSLTAIGSTLLLCRMFGLTEAITQSLFPKSVTTAIAIEIATERGGIASITVGAVAVAGITGAMLSPFLVNVLKLKNKTAIGLAIGTSSHALGTTRAMEMGKEEGAMSAVALSASAVITVILSMFL